MTADLDPLDPAAALELYIDHRRGEISRKTRRAHENRIGAFVEWCDEVAEIHNMNDVTGRDLHAFRVYRREEDELKPVSIQSQLSTLRVFLKFCVSIDAVPEGLPDKIILPTIRENQRVDKEVLEPELGEAALDYLSKYHYANRRHVVFALLWKTGMQMGSLRPLDLEDFDRERSALQLVHRPETGTPLKNQVKGERWVALSDRLRRVLVDFIEGPRTDLRDDHGRRPLVTTERDRVSTATIRRDTYVVTRPCFLGQECPHDREIEECEATAMDHASKCPSSKSPHPVRSGAITGHLLDDVPTEIVSERMDVSGDVLDAHYDRRTEREKMEQRREYLR